MCELKTFVLPPYTSMEADLEEGRKDVVKDWSGLPIAECVNMARDRTAWRSFMSSSLVLHWSSIFRNEEELRQGKARPP